MSPTDLEALTGELLREIAAAETILERPWPNLRRLATEIHDAALTVKAEESSVDPTAPTVLDVAWTHINVLGAPDTACRTAEDLAYCRGIGDALAEIEKLGGQPS